MFIGDYQSMRKMQGGSEFLVSSLADGKECINKGKLILRSIQTSPMAIETQYL